MEIVYSIPNILLCYLRRPPLLIGFLSEWNWHTRRFGWARCWCLKNSVGFYEGKLIL